MKKVMVIAGGDWQIELIKKLKSMGHYVICSNLYEDSPAFKYSDACEVCDVLDKEGNLEIAKKYMPDAVISDQSDIAVSTVAYVNDKLGLRGIGLEKANLFTDKSELRIFCKQNHITVPDFKICRNYEDALDMLKTYKKIIIKPIDSQSSRGVFTIESEEALKLHVKETISFSNRRKEFLSEEYIGGDEFTIDGLVVNYKHYPLCISIKEMYESNSNISRMQTYTYRHEKYDYDELRCLNKKLIEKIGLPFGLTHSEYKCYNGKFYLIEAGARGGGSNLSAKIVPFMSHIDNYEYLIKSSLGEHIDTDVLEKLELPQNKSVIMRFFDFGEGVVKNVKGLDMLKGNKLLIDYQLKICKGDILKMPIYGRLRPGHFIIGGDNLIEVQKAANEIISKVKVDFE